MLEHIQNAIISQDRGNAYFLPMDQSQLFFKLLNFEGFREGIDFKTRFSWYV